MGSGKAEFKLLAAQRSEHDWSSVPGEEMIAAPDDAPYAGGVLVLIELTNNRQIKRHQEAGRTLVSILQNFSSLSKKFKSQGEEIEQWKESLTYQSQALNRREMEIESRQEQVDQAEADLEKIAAQKQEIAAQKAEVEQLQASLTKKNSELEGAWAHLNGEIQRFEERQESAAPEGIGGISEEQAYQMSWAIAQLTQGTADAAGIGSDLSAVLELVASYQAALAEDQQRLEQKRIEVGDAQAELESQTNALTAAGQALSETETGLHTAQLHLQQQQALLGAKQDQNQLLTEQLKNQTTLHQRVYELLNAADKVRLSKKVDISALEAMPESSLQSLVSSLEQDLDKMVRFVNDQEEELNLQQEDIDALKAKLDGVSEYDRLQIETEIAEEKDRHVMLNRTLVGQRRNLLEREEVLSQHRAILLRRQGLSAEGTGAAAELEPVLDEIDELRAGLGEQIQQVESEIAQLQTEVDTLKQSRQQLQEQLETHKHTVEKAKASQVAQQQRIDAAQGQIALYEQLLPPVEEQLGGLYQKLNALSAVIERMQSVEAQQQAAIANAQQMLQTMMAPEPALV